LNAPLRATTAEDAMMDQEVALPDDARHLLQRHGLAEEVAPGIARLRDRIVNVYLVGEAGARDRRWALVDTGLPGATEKIVEAVAARFGADSRPAGIVLTHGHFDHVGAVEHLAERWDVPVYAHELELPYLTGRSAYPPPDPTVGGGALAFMSRTFPRGPIDLGERVHALPEDGAVPGMPGWRWIHTPGHAPGHVSLFREGDRALVAGDAFVTTKQESLVAALTQRKEIHGPPAYYTIDWDEARESVRRLAELHPTLAATGHGAPMRGVPMQRGLDELARDFDRIARPARGRYVREPAIADASGVVTVPPAVPDPLARVLTGVAVAAVAGAAVVALRRRGRGGKDEHVERAD
jgi:glyoxylase-like metal-dependent hydrolase (beta-lactamase superfamily II)